MPNNGTNLMRMPEEVTLSELIIPPFQRGPKHFAERIAQEFDPYLADPIKVARITDLKNQPLWILDGAQRFTAMTLIGAENGGQPTKAYAYLEDMTRKEAYDYCLKANTERIKFEMFDQFPVLAAKGDKTARIMIAAAKEAGVTFLMREAKSDTPLVRSVSSAGGWVHNVMEWAEGESELVTNGLAYGLNLCRSWQVETDRKAFPPAWTMEGAATLGLFYDGVVDPKEVGSLLPAWTSLKNVTGKGAFGRYEARALLLAETVNTNRKGLLSKPRATIALK